MTKASGWGVRSVPLRANRAQYGHAHWQSTRTVNTTAALLLAGLLGSLACSGAWAWVSVRDQEIAQCLPGEIATWGDGRDGPAVHTPMVFVYDHTNAPVWFTQAVAAAAIENAQDAWSQCGVPGRVVVAASQAIAAEEFRQSAVLVQWSDTGSRNNFGLANLGERTLSLGPSAFALLQKRNPAYDARQTLQMVISHEMGHFYGLMAHSRRCVDVTSYYNNGKGEQCHTRSGVAPPPGYEYRATLPTACDIARCVAANKKF